MTRTTSNPPKQTGAQSGTLVPTGKTLTGVSESFAAVIWVVLGN
jgi:hypothetical protein